MIVFLTNNKEPWTLVIIFLFVRHQWKKFFLFCYTLISEIKLFYYNDFEWINEWCIYIVLYCVLLYTQSTLQSGLSSTTTSVQHPLGWCDGCHRTTAPVRSPHTGYRWRVREPIKWMGIIRRPWFGQDTGVTPYSFARSAMGFLMTTESQDLSLTSHPKDGKDKKILL